jgi:hypothetical protein
VKCQDYRQALAQALEILPVAARLDSTPAKILQAARGAGSAQESFQKDGFEWIGKVGLKLDSQGRLTEVVPAWAPF